MKQVIVVTPESMASLVEDADAGDRDAQDAVATIEEFSDRDDQACLKCGNEFNPAPVVCIVICPDQVAGLCDKCVGPDNYMDVVRHQLDKIGIVYEERPQ